MLTIYTHTCFGHIIVCGLIPGNGGAPTANSELAEGQCSGRQFASAAADSQATARTGAASYQQGSRAPGPAGQSKPRGGTEAGASLTPGRR